MEYPQPDPLPPDRAVTQKSHLHDAGTDALARAVARAAAAARGADDVSQAPPAQTVAAPPAVAPTHPAERAWASRPQSRR